MFSSSSTTSTVGRGLAVVMAATLPEVVRPCLEETSRLPVDRGPPATSGAIGAGPSAQSETRTGSTVPTRSTDRPQLPDLVRPTHGFLATSGRRTAVKSHEVGGRPH